MIRQPSTFRQLYDWHSRALKGERPPLNDGDAFCGWYRTRMVRGGPWVPVRIYVERDIDPTTGELASPEVLRMEIAGQPGGDPRARFSYLTAITRAEYERLMEAHDTSLAMAATHVRFDVTATPARP